MREPRQQDDAAPRAVARQARRQPHPALAGWLAGSRLIPAHRVSSRRAYKLRSQSGGATLCSLARSSAAHFYNLRLLNFTFMFHERTMAMTMMKLQLQLQLQLQLGLAASCQERMRHAKLNKEPPDACSVCLHGARLLQQLATSARSRPRPRPPARVGRRSQGLLSRSATTTIKLVARISPTAARKRGDAEEKLRAAMRSPWGEILCLILAYCCYCCCCCCCYDDERRRLVETGTTLAN